MNNNTYFYHDKPVFGLDIGYSSVKVMQIDKPNRKHKRPVIGYGAASFDPNSNAIKNGVVINPEQIAEVIYDMFEKNIVGEINTKRVAIAIPASRTFNRAMTLPKMRKQDIDQAVHLEAEQYIPMPINDLYLDYSIVTQTEENIELLAVAVPKKVIDSYIDLARMLGLEVVTMETTISAGSRLFVNSEPSDVPTVLIDFGSLSSDITIYDKGLVVTGTVNKGGDDFTSLIAQKLGVTKGEANVIKTKYGLGQSKKQKEISEGMKVALDELVKEIRRMIRYYEERATSDSKIHQIVTMGGGANMPGLSDYLTNLLRIPVRMCDPWHMLDFAGLQPPNNIEKSMYVTVSGLALINPGEIFK